MGLTKLTKLGDLTRRIAGFTTYREVENSMLRGIKPTTIEKRFKGLFFGKSGVGKTTAAMQFPKPYFIDTERGAENDSYVKLLNKAHGSYFFTTDPDELIREVTALLSENHDYVTLVIDPLTVIYNDLLDKAADTVGTDFGRHKIPADRKIKHLLNLLLRLDMNVIITSHAKAKYIRTKDKTGKDTIIEDGTTFDCYAKLDYLFDLVIEVEKRGKSDRVGIVRKTRIESFPEGDIFPFCYDEIANRYGRKILERGAIPVALATAEQVAELNALVTLLNLTPETTEKWLDKAGAESFTEMTSDYIGKVIDACKAKVNSPLSERKVA